MSKRRRNLLFIGANTMGEIANYVNDYKHGLFIEALPDIYKKLQVNLRNANRKYRTDFVPINCLVSDIANKEYTFNIFSNNGSSSSIYEPNMDIWEWPHAIPVSTIKLKSTTISNLLKEHNWENKKYDLVLDVQGAELDVLKGFGDKNFENVQHIKTEISTKEYYKSGVLFDELHSYITSHGFTLDALPSTSHCDVTYTRIGADDTYGSDEEKEIATEISTTEITTTKTQETPIVKESPIHIPKQIQKASSNTIPREMPARLKRRIKNK